LNDANFGVGHLEFTGNIELFVPKFKILMRLSDSEDFLGHISFALDGLYCRVSTRQQFAVLPPSYVLEFENAVAGRGLEWSELHIRVDPHADGSVSITALSAIASPYDQDLIDSGGRVLVSAINRKVGETFVFSNAIAIGYLPTSYGINPVANVFKLAEDGSKVLVTEYRNPVCKVVTVQSLELYATDYWPADSAPRHNRLMNVLFVGGHVQQMGVGIPMAQPDPHTIHPGILIQRNEYWLPTGLQQGPPNEWGF
jgi:prepilin-type processing-associated H-X9-DG protein